MKFKQLILSTSVFLLCQNHLSTYSVVQAFGRNRQEEPSRDFYKILGIKRSANDKEIKRAFKKMSLKNHPDKNPNDEEALNRYQDISAAYTVLGDQEKRRKYTGG